MNARHLRQVDIVRAAQASGVKLGKSHISQYVSGKTTPRADTLRFLADTLQVDEQWLLGHDRGRPGMPAQPKRVPDNTAWQPPPSVLYSGCHVPFLWGQPILNAKNQTCFV